MHLEKIRTVLFDEITTMVKNEFPPRYSKDPVRISLSLAVLIGVLVVTILSFAGVKGNLYTIITTLLFFTAIGGEYVFSANELYLPANTRRFQWKNRAEIKRIRRRVEQFNNALRAQENAQWLLPQTARDNDKLLAEYWEQTRRNLQADVDKLLKGFQEAASKDSEQLEKKLNPTLGHREFRYKVEQLKKLEASLENLQNGYNGTPPYVTVAELRAQLEAERVELGLPQRALPKPKSRKMQYLVESFTPPKGRR